MKVMETDCLVIGSGLAGSIYAYVASNMGLNCTLLSSTADLSYCNSNLAQGGIIYPKQNDSKLTADFQKASHNTTNPTSLAIATEYGEKILEDLLLNTLNVPFDKDENGQLLYTKEAAHSIPRILYSKDHTGEVILTTLHNALKKQKKNLKILDKTAAIDLLTLSHSSKNLLDKYNPLTAVGAYALNTDTNEVFAIKAKKTILATGGLGKLYLHSTNCKNSFGSGVSMAYRVGARIMNMEYIQFHPTVFYKKGTPPFLVSEAVRGEGGVLVNNKGNSFMENYHPDESLAPRDVVARAIKSEIFKTNGDCVYIDLSKMDKGFAQKRFPKIYQSCLKHGIDINKDPIPVVPAAHYFCGGIYTDNAGSTNIRSLSAIGETACTGLHGSNRLASSSLLECLVMGVLAAKKDAQSIQNDRFLLPEIREWQAPTDEADTLLIKQDLSLIQNTMWNYVGLIRTEKRLLRATKILAELKLDIDTFYANSALTRELLDLRNAIQNSMLITYAATKNTKSIGCHFRNDN